MEKLSDRKQRSIETARKNINMNNVSSGKFERAKKSLKRDKDFRFGDFLPTEVISRLNEMRRRDDDKES